MLVRSRSRGSGREHQGDQQKDRNGGQTDRQKRPLPRQSIGKEAAEYRPDDEGHAVNAAQQAMKLASFLRITEIGDGHVAAGHDGAAAGALHGAEDNDLGHRFTEAQEARAGAENRQTQQQVPPTPVGVAQPADDRKCERGRDYVRRCGPCVAVESAQLGDDEGHGRVDHGLAQRAQEHCQHHTGNRSHGLSLRRRREAVVVRRSIVAGVAVTGFGARVRPDALFPAARF